MYVTQPQARKNKRALKKIVKSIGQMCAAGELQYIEDIARQSLGGKWLNKDYWGPIIKYRYNMEKVL